MEAKITLRIAGKTQPGLLAPCGTGGPVVILDEHPDMSLTPDDLNPDHLIIVHESKQDAWDPVQTAVDSGFNVTWEGELGK
jgi:hypothetical protein